MAPFPTRHVRKPSDGLLPTFHSPSPASSPSLSSPLSPGAGGAAHAYPPLPASPNPSQPSSPRSHSPVTMHSQEQQLDPRKLFGGMSAPSRGSTGGLGGITAQSRETVRKCLEDNHIHSHTFFNDKGFHNHCSHHLLAAYSLGATPSLIEDIFKLHRETSSKPMLPLAPRDITETNWTEHLGDETYYPNYLAFFHRLIAASPPPASPYAGRKSSVVPVLERYLFGGEGQMLVRAVSGAIHPLIHIGHGIEFGLDEHVAEGLAQCAVHKPAAAPLFPEEWPPRPTRPSQLQSTLSSAFSSLRFTSAFNASTASYFGSHPIASPSDSFAATAATLPRDRRYPRSGLSGFTILSRILHDEALAPGRANTLDDFPKLDAVLRNRAGRIIQWCEEWRFSNERAAEWEDAETPSAAKGKSKGATPGWDECVEKCEELWWMATVIYAAAARPGYKDIKLDFFTMHGLTSVMFLPPLLEAISPHLRPYLLTSHFRILVAYWISRGRPDLYVAETLMAATPCPRAPPTSTLPPTSAVRRAIDEGRSHKGHDPEDPTTTSGRNASPTDGGESFADSPSTPKAQHTQPFPVPDEEDAAGDGTNAWMRVLASAVDHHDEHVTKVVRSLFYAATHFGTSEKGIFTSSLPGTELMDGSIFIRAAGLTLAATGWAHEGDHGTPGAWDRSALGFSSTWEDSELLLGASWPPPSRNGDRKGKGREGAFSPSSSTASFSRSRSGTLMPTASGAAPPEHDVVHFSTAAGDSALLSPQAASGGFGTIPRSASPTGSNSSRSQSRSGSPGSGARGSIEGRQGWRKVGEEVTDEDRDRMSREDEERELMA